MTTFDQKRTGLSFAASGFAWEQQRAITKVTGDTPLLVNQPLLQPVAWPPVCEHPLLPAAVNAHPLRQTPGMLLGTSPLTAPPVLETIAWQPPAVLRTVAPAGTEVVTTITTCQIGVEVGPFLLGKRSTTIKQSVR